MLSLDDLKEEHGLEPADNSSKHPDQTELEHVIELVRSGSGAFTELNEYLDKIGHRRAVERYREVMLGLAGRLMEFRDPHVEIALRSVGLNRSSNAEIAEYCGVDRSTVYRIAAKLRA